MLLRVGLSVLLTSAVLAAGAAAGPWAQPGDTQLRSDVAILAGAGVVDNLTTHWPLPWASLLDDVNSYDAAAGQPEFVREAAERLYATARINTHLRINRGGFMIDAATNPNFIRGFDALSRQSMEGRFSVDYLWSSTAIHIAATARTTDKGDRRIFVPDGSFVAQRIGGAVVYAGYLDHWWGPGWISTLSVSTNARPIPQIGIVRAGTAPSRSPWLRWMGPWQMEFFVGVLDGPRIARNTIYSGFRFAFSPIPHLELGASRTDEMCGSGHPCNPLKGYFNFANQDNDINIVNDQGTFDIRYSDTLGRWAYEFYAQAMNEDSSPIVHSGTSHLIGGSIWLPLDTGLGRLTVEYTDSVATINFWGEGAFHGVAYNNHDYPDGMRYRGRTLGFSLDSDSRLLSIQTNFTDKNDIGYTLTLHHAEVSHPQNTWGNAVTTAPVIVNMIQARVSLPFKLDATRMKLDVEARVQDDQPRPNSGFLASIEARLSVGF